MMIASVIVFGIFSGYFLSVLVGIIGSRRRIGFGWTFLLSLIFTPLVGLILALISDPLPAGEKRWGCLGFSAAVMGVLCMIIFALLLLVVLV